MEEPKPKKQWEKPVFRNLRLFIKLFLATYKYGMIITAAAFGAIYVTYFFFASNIFIDWVSSFLILLYPTAQTQGAESAGSRLQGCIIQGIPECDGRAFTEKSIFAPVN
jgi:hypothetical protein